MSVKDRPTPANLRLCEVCTGIGHLDGWRHIRNVCPECEGSGLNMTSADAWKREVRQARQEAFAKANPPLTDT